jgi:hypothetical protein
MNVHFNVYYWLKEKIERLVQKSDEW